MTEPLIVSRIVDCDVLFLEFNYCWVVSVLHSPTALRQLYFTSILLT